MKPFVSVVLACRNEAADIGSCVNSILKQETPSGGFEVLIADGMSTDGTREFLNKMAEKHPQIRVIENPGRIVSTGLNAAIRAARGEIIVRMDAHTVFAPDYIKQCVAVLERTGADNVGGPARTTTETAMERAIATAYHSPFSVGGARFHDVNYEGYVDTVTYGCWKRSHFEKVGYFDEELVRNQDDEHNLRITRSGGKIYQSTSIRSYYRPRSSLNSLFKQYMQYGYWKVPVIQKHRMPASIRHLVPGLFLLISGILLVTGFFKPQAFYALGAIWGVYFLFLLTASVLASQKSQWKLFAIYPAIFACFHLGYGYGFMRGLVDFIFFRKAPRREFMQLTRGNRPGKMPPTTQVNRGARL